MLHHKHCIFYDFTYFLEKRIAFVVLATIMVLTGVSLGIIYSLPPKTYTKPGKIKDLHNFFVHRGILLQKCCNIFLHISSILIEFAFILQLNHI